MKKYKMILLSAGVVLALAGCSGGADQKTDAELSVKTEAGKQVEAEVGKADAAEKEAKKEMETVYVAKSMVYYFDDGSVNYSREYEYDDQANIIGINVYDENGELYTKTKKTYDNECRILVDHTEFADGKLRQHGEYEYDENGLMKKVTYYDEDHEIMSWYDYEVDEAGRILRYDHYAAGDTEPDTILYSWEGNCLVETLRVDDDGRTWSDYAYQYDAEGRCITCGDTSSSNRHEFQYDENGCMTGWDWGNEEERKSYGVYEYITMEISKDDARRQYDNAKNEPVEIIFYRTADESAELEDVYAGKLAENGVLIGDWGNYFTELPPQTAAYPTVSYPECWRAEKKTDSGGRPSSEIVYDENDVKRIVVEYYDGQLQKISEYDENGNPVKYTTINTVQNSVAEVEEWSPDLMEKRSSYYKAEGGYELDFFIITKFKEPYDIIKYDNTLSETRYNGDGSFDAEIPVRKWN